MLMPELCRFNGIVISIVYSDHPPPHFHVRYSGVDATVDIESLSVRSEALPPRVVRQVNEWASRRQSELWNPWERASLNLPPDRIDP